MTLRFRKHVAVLAAALIVFAGCGSDDEEPVAADGSAAPDASDAPEGGGEKTDAQAYYASVEDLTGEERTAKLVEDAKACKGPVSVYSGSSVAEVHAVEFQELYGVEAEVYRANSETVTQRALQERDAGYVGADVIESDSKAMNILAKEGFFAPYESSLLEDILPDAIHDDWIGSNMYVFAVGWNTDMVDGEELPDTLEDFADEKWEDMLALEIGDSDWYAAIYQHYLDEGMTEEEVVELLGAIGANAQTGKGHTAMTELMSAGQFAILITGYSHNIDLAASNGAPVAWQREDGSTVQPNVTKFQGFGLIENAECPAGAVLWGDYVLSEGQEVLAQEFRYGTINLDEGPLGDLDLLPVPEEEVETNLDVWEDRYGDMLRS